jgi:O-acetyl-ADP-ribose deacetylase (regulator of RNase III)
MVDYIEGDLFYADLPAIGHGVNCMGLMGKGIAKEFRRRYPEMYKAYRQLCLDRDLKLGDMFVWEPALPDEPLVYNLATQYSIGACADLVAISKAVEMALRDCAERKITHLGLPHIGSGVGGLAWAEVEEILEEISELVPEVTLVVVTQPPRPAAMVVDGVVDGPLWGNKLAK